MRYLLIFYAEHIGQWRFLDTAQLGRAGLHCPEDLPEMLNHAPEVTLGWMLGPRDFGGFQRQAGTEGAEWVRVHALAADRTVLAQDRDYQGAWLEMFMQENTPIGWIPARRSARAAGGAAQDLLRSRAEDPLRAEAEACRQTMGQMRARQQAQRGPRRQDPPMARPREKA